MGRDDLTLWPLRGHLPFADSAKGRKHDLSSVGLCRRPQSLLLGEGAVNLVA